MIWNPWKKIEELELDLSIQKMTYEKIDAALQRALKSKDAEITELQQTIALLVDGEFKRVSDLIEAKRAANLHTRQRSDLQSYANMVGNLGRQYPKQSFVNKLLPDGINAITGGFF